MTSQCPVAPVHGKRWGRLKTTGAVHMSGRLHSALTLQTSSSSHSGAAVRSQMPGWHLQVNQFPREQEEGWRQGRASVGDTQTSLGDSS